LEPKSFAQNRPEKPKTDITRIEQGSLSYNWNYRSALDTPFAGIDLSQHLVSASATFLLIDKLPIRVNYAGRETNSQFYRNYHDVRVEVDVQRLQRLRIKRAFKQFKENVESLRNPITAASLEEAKNKWLQTKNFLDDVSITRQFIQSKETLLRQHFKDTSVYYKDSVVNRAKLFLKYYDSLQIIQKRYLFQKDSIHAVIQDIERKIRTVERLTMGDNISTQNLSELGAIYGQNDKNFQRLLHAHNGIKVFSLGRSFPAYSNLTLQNVAVNGLNVEYQDDNFFIATAVGGVDFRMRDFLFEQGIKREPQYVWFTKVGYGRGDHNNIAISYFNGKKQFISNSLPYASSAIQGLSLSGQYYVNKYTRVYGELAQSGTPASTSSFTEKPSFRFGDNSHQAYSVGVASFLPSTQTRIEGYYQRTGINYQCFNSFQYNATFNSWSAKIEQPFWKRQLFISASVRKNDFSNPYVLQRYKANTIFKTGMLTFQKTNWPVLSAGYQPVSQNIIVGSQMYENHFQAFTGSLMHQYKIGLAKAATTVMYSRFYNASDDSSLIYFNAKNIFWNQTFFFDLFSANLGASVMSNNQYSLLVLEGGGSATFFRSVQLDFGVKVNHLQKEETRFGFKGGTRFLVKNIGEFNVWAEKSYLPSTHNNLYQYEMYNLGFTRFFQ
jgi:hypothetical protein